MARGLDAIAKIGVELDKLSLQNANNQLAQASKSAAKFNNNPIVAKNYTQPLGRITGAANEFTKSLEASNARVLAFGASAGALFAVQKGMQELVKTTVTLERQFKEIELLMGETTKGFAAFQKELFEISRRTGKVFSEVAESTTEFARQGLNAEETAKRVSAAMTLSALSGMKAKDATEALTAAVNTFNNSSLDAITIVNKLAQADAKFAVSSEDLAEGIKRSGAAALDAKVDFAELGALITSLQQNTARGGAVIGNSLKSIFTRIQSPEVLNQLEKLGIEVRGVNDETLSAMTILRNYAKEYNRLGASTKAVTSELVAGKFQINALKSIMADLNSTVSVTDEALKTISQSSNEATTRLAQLQNTTQGKLNETMTSLKEFALQAGSQALVPAVENILSVINTTIGAFRIDDAESIGGKIGTGIYEGIGKVLSGPGLVLIGAILAKIGINLFKFLAESGKQFLNLNKAATEQAKIENVIQNILIRRPDILQQIAKKQMSIKDLEKGLTGQIKMSNAELQLSVKLAQQLSQQMAMAGVMSKGIGGAAGFLPTSSSGFVPAARKERAGAAAGGYGAGDIKQTNIKGVGKVTYNNNESVIKFPGFEQPAIMPPLYSKAGKNYQDKFMGVHGFDPYASSGFIPNFSTKGFGKAHIEALPEDDEIRKEYNAKVGPDKRTYLNSLDQKTKDRLKENLAKKSGVSKDITSGEVLKQKTQLQTNLGHKVAFISLLPLQGNAKGSQNTYSLMENISALKGQSKELGFADNATLMLRNVLIGDSQSIMPNIAEGDTNVRNEFGRKLNEALAQPLVKLSGEMFKEYQDAVQMSDSELAKRLKGSFGDRRIVPSHVEGGIFEEMVRIAAEPSNFLKKKGTSSEKAPFDFTSKAGVSNIRRFFGLPSDTKVVDIKRNAIDSLNDAVAKSVNHWASKRSPSIGAGFDDVLSSAGFDRGLSRLGAAAAVEEGDVPRALPLGKKDKTKKAAFGFIPNFAMGLGKGKKLLERGKVRLGDLRSEKRQQNVIKGKALSDQAIAYLARTFGVSPGILATISPAMQGEMDGRAEYSRMKNPKGRMGAGIKVGARSFEILNNLHIPAKRETFPKKEILDAISSFAHESTHALQAKIAGGLHGDEGLYNDSLWASKSGNISPQEALNLIPENKRQGAIDYADSKLYSQRAKELGVYQTESSRDYERTAYYAGAAARHKAEELYGFAGGLIPNFSIQRRLQESIQREKRAGVKGRDVRVGFDKRLKSSGGIGVFNKDEGSLQNAIDMHMSLGKNSAEIQKQGRLASAGYVPNFATELTEIQQLNLERLGGGVRQKGARRNLAGPELKRFLNSFRRITQSVEAGTVPLAQLKERAQNLANEFNLSTTSIDKAVNSIEKLDAAVDRTADSTEDLRNKKDDESKTSQDSSSKLIGLSMAAGVLSPMLTSVSEKFINLESASGRNAAAVARTTTEMIALVSTMAILKSTMMEFTVFQKLSAMGSTPLTGQGGIGRSIRAAAIRGGRKIGVGKGVASVLGSGGKAAGAAKGAGALGGLTLGGLAMGGAAVGGGILAVTKLMDALSDIDLENQNKAATEALDKTKKMTAGLRKAADAMDKLAAGTEDLSKAETARLRAQLTQGMNEAGLSKKQKDEIRGFLEKGELEKAGKIISDQVTKTNLRQTAQESRLRFGTDSQMKFQERDDLNAADIENMRMLISTAITKNGETFSSFLNENKDLQKDLDKFVRNIEEAPERTFFSTGAGDTATLLKSLNEATEGQFKDGESPFALLEKVLVDNQQGPGNRFERIFETAGSSAEFANLGKAGDLISDFIQEMIDGASSFGESIKKGETERNRQLALGRKIREQLVKELTARQRLVGQLQSNLKVEQILEKGRLKANQIANKSMITMFSKTSSKLSAAVLEFEKNIQQIDFSAAQQRKALADQAGLDNEKLFNEFFAKQLEKLEDPKQLADLGAEPDDFKNELNRLKTVFQNADVESLSTDLRGFVDSAKSEALKKELRGLAEAAEENRIKLSQNTDELSANIAVQKQLENANRKAQVEQTLQQRRLEFGAGASMSPTTTISNFRKARGDVFFGRQSGDVERETKGLVEQAKALKGLRLGLANPAETLMQPVQERFEKNLTAFAKEAVGGRALTEDEKKSIQLAAKEQMEALIEPEKTQKETNKRLEHATSALIGLTTATTALTQAFTQPNNPPVSGPADDRRSSRDGGTPTLPQEGAKATNAPSAIPASGEPGSLNRVANAIETRVHTLTQPTAVPSQQMAGASNIPLFNTTTRLESIAGTEKLGDYLGFVEREMKLVKSRSKGKEALNKDDSEFPKVQNKALLNLRNDYKDIYELLAKFQGKDSVNPDGSLDIVGRKQLVSQIGDKVGIERATEFLNKLEEIYTKQREVTAGPDRTSARSAPQPKDTSARPTPGPNARPQPASGSPLPLVSSGAVSGVSQFNMMYGPRAPKAFIPDAPQHGSRQGVVQEYMKTMPKAPELTPAIARQILGSLQETIPYGHQYRNFLGVDSSDARRLHKKMQHPRMTMMTPREFAAGGPGHYPLRDPRDGGGEGVGKTYKGDPHFKAGRTFKDNTIRKQQQELVKLYKLLGTFNLPLYRNDQSIKEYRDQLRKIMEQRGMDPKELKMFDKGVPRFKGYPSTIDPQASLDLPRDMEVALSGMKDLADAGLQRGSIFTHDINTEAALLLTASKVEQLSNSIAQFVSTDAPKDKKDNNVNIRGIVRKDIEEAAGIKAALLRNKQKANPIRGVASAAAYGDQRQEDRMRRNEARGSGHLREGDKTLFKYNQKGERTGVHTPNMPTPVTSSGLTILEIAEAIQHHGPDALTEEETELINRKDKQGNYIFGFDPKTGKPLKGKAGQAARRNIRIDQNTRDGGMKPSNPGVQQQQQEQRENIEAAETGKPSPPPNAEEKDKERKIAQANAQAKIKAVEMEEAFGKYISGISKSFETRAAESIKSSVGGQITQEYAALANKLAGDFKLAEGAIGDNERSVGRFAAALNNAKAAGVDLATLNEERIKFLEELKGKEHDLTEVRQLAIRGINKLEQEELAKRFREAKEDFDANLLDNDQKRAIAQDLLNKRLETGQATLSDITNVISSDMSYNFNSFQKDVANGSIELFDTFKSGTKSALGEAIRGTSTLKEAFSKVFQSIADKALDRTLDIAVDALFAGINRTVFQGSKGGYIKGYNSGGMVSGGSGYKDDVPAMLTRGEYVIRKSAVNKYGEEFFQKLNTGGMAILAKSVVGMPSFRKTKRQSQYKVRQGKPDGVNFSLEPDEESFQKLNTGGMAKEIRTARSADIRLLNEYVYDDPKRPTSGRFNEDQRLSAFARRNEDDRTNVLKFERERALKDYIKARDEHYKQQDEIQAAFKRQLRGRRRSALIGAGLSLGISGIFNYAQKDPITKERGDFFGRTRAYRSPFGGDKMVGREFNGVKIGPLRTGGPMAAPGNAEGPFGVRQKDLLIKDFKAPRGMFGNATGGFSARDNVPAMLMGGEYVVNKDTVNRYGKNFFDQLNSGRVRGYAQGGLVGGAGGAGGAGSSTVGDTNVSITVNIEGNGNAVTTETSENEERRSGGEQGKQLADTIKVAVLNELTNQKRPGGILYGN